MLVTLIKKTRISTITLPERVHGQYWVQDTDEQGRKTPLMSIEGINGGWVLKTSRKAVFPHGTQDNRKSVDLKAGQFYDIEIVKSKTAAVIYTEAITADRQRFQTYTVADNCELSIGRLPTCDICYGIPYASQKHATLSRRNGKWFIGDFGSRNGTFVNNTAVSGEQQLYCGDVIFILGLKLILGEGFVACNNPDSLVSLNAARLKPLKPEKLITEVEEEEEESEDYFYRSPRFKREIKQAVFKIDAPPSDQVGDEMPAMLLIGPSVTMGLASVATGTFSIVNAISNGNITAAIPSAVMSFSMLLGTMLWPVISKRYEKKRKHKKEALRQEKYAQYLTETGREIQKECERQQTILNENSATVEDCTRRIEACADSLWERGAAQNDFLTFRLGRGVKPLDAELRYQERKFTLEEDNLLADMYTLCESPKVLENVPISVSLTDSTVTGIIGQRKKVLAFVQGIILQLTALYAYDEVRCVFIYDEQEDAALQYVKWLPHVWNEQQSFRFVATNNTEMKEVSAYLEREIEQRAENSPEKMNEALPYYVIFAINRRLSMRADMLKQILASKKNLNMSVVACYDELKDLPKECNVVLDLAEDTGRMYQRSDISGNSVTFLPDILVNTDLLPLAKKLANVQLDSGSSAFKLPQVVTFLEMFGVGKVEHLNSLTRWKENDPTKSLEAAVGVDTLGDTFMLDLHEKFHGPHGLVAGMTGSGKSEFIITYILSLAVNYHPDELAFILIDYKGGGMAKSFEHLPHTAGIITNLDGASIRRSLTSIESELVRRQAIFSRTSKEAGVSNIDIYKYQKLYREGKVHEPLQHLFIISDEFAELKTQQPEFMAQLVSAARIGRSLGIHLILATQKPAGVVDDQIWSNSKFRVCLKVQDRSDSMDMLKRPDAAALTDTGRFYLQVGYNELFEMGQSAWAGAPYYPSERVTAEKDDSIAVIDRNGRVIKRVRPNKHTGLTAPAPKQLDAITHYLQSIAQEENIHIRQLWLEPIPGKIYLDEVRQKYHLPLSGGFELAPLLGELDDPRNQRQIPFFLPLSTEGNAVIYGAAGSGKTSFLNAMLYSLITEHTADEVHIYILDFASETLRAFAKAPQVGDVVLSYEGEKVSNLFKLLLTEVEQRKKLFADYGGDYHAYLASSGQTLPGIVVAINNFAALTELYEEKEEAVSFLSREGKKYGLYFVITALGTGAVRFRLLQNFKQLLTMQLNDESDYASIVGKTEGLIPAKHQGRGLVKLDGVYEFQTAYLTTETVPFGFVQEQCRKLAAQWNGSTARKVPILPSRVDVPFLREYYNMQKPLDIPIGVEANSLEVYACSLADSYISLLASATDYHMDLLYALAELLHTAVQELYVLDAPKCFAAGIPQGVAYYSEAGDCNTAVDKLFEIVLSRNNTYKQAKANGDLVPKFAQVVLLINSVGALKAALSEEQNEKLGLILERGEVSYNITVVIADTAKNLSGVSYEKWYKKHISQLDGIWIGDGFSEQYQLKATKLIPELRMEIGADFAIALHKGVAVKVKRLRHEFEEDEAWTST